MKREYSLDVLRILATVGIVFHHFQQLTGFHFENGWNFHGGVFSYGIIVEFFFLLSGYLAYKYAKSETYSQSLKAFILPKMKRLLPIVFVSAVAYEGLLHIYIRVCERSWLLGKNLTVWGTLTNGLGLQAGWVFENQMVNNPTWYVSVLLLCYILYYFFGYLGRTKNIPVHYLYMGMILLGMAIRENNPHFPFLDLYAGRGYLAFFFGLLLAGILEGKKLAGKAALKCLLVLVVMTYGLVFHYPYFEYGIAYLMTFIYYPAALILFLSEPVKKVFDCKLFGFLGTITYQVYVWQVPMILLMYIVVKVFALPVKVESSAGMLVFTIWMFVWGIISHYLVDGPIQKWFKKEK